MVLKSCASHKISKINICVAQELRRAFACVLFMGTLCACGSTQSREPEPVVVAQSQVLQQRSEKPASSQCTRLIDGGSAFGGHAGLEAAHRLFLQKKWPQAGAAFETAIKDLAANVSSSTLNNAKLLCALSYYNDNAYEKASVYFKDILEQGYLAPELFVQDAMEASYKSQHYEQVIGYAKRYEQDSWSQSYEGMSLAALGKHEDALAVFSGIKRFPPELQLEALQSMLQSQMALSNTRAAIQSLMKIYELDPKSEQGKLAQEQILSMKDQWPEDFRFPPAPKVVDRKKSERELALGHFNAHRSDKAIKAYSALLKADKKAQNRVLACEDLFYIARSYVKLRAHSKSLPYFKEGKASCKDTDIQIKILYAGARAAWNAGQLELAIEYYQSIVNEYPKHSYADDAMLFEAQILQSQQKTDEAEAKLRSQLSKYPAGDMAKDALWLLFLHYYETKQWQAAIDFVDAQAGNTGEDDLYTLGRLAYFSARAYEQLGKVQEAIALYEDIMTRYPLGYYAMIALGAYHALAPQKAQDWVERHKPPHAQPTQAQEHCFVHLGEKESFGAIKALLALGLQSQALQKVSSLTSHSDKEIAQEAQLARAIILQRMGRYSESARTAFGLLDPVLDLELQRYDTWLLAYPQPWLSTVEKVSTKGSDLFFTVYAIMREESYYDPRAESWANARGLMQLMLPTAQSTASALGVSKPEAKDLFMPEVSIPLGAAYIEKLVRILAPSPLLVLPGYNAGQGNVGKWMKERPDIALDLFVEKIPFKEARHYAKRVSSTLWRYRWLYDATRPVPLNATILVRDIK